MKSATLLNGEPYDPEIDPENFVNPSQIGSSVETNPYWPLVPGNTWVYENEEGELVSLEGS